MKAKTWWETVFKILTENDLNFSTQPNSFGGPWGGQFAPCGLAEGNSNPPQYSGLENSLDRGAWWARAKGVAKSQT